MTAENGAGLDAGLQEWFRDLVESEAREKGQQLEDLAANQAAMEKAAEAAAEAQRSAEAVQAMADPEQPEDPESLERVRDLIRRKIHERTKVWIYRFVRYRGEESEQYEITTSKGTVRFTNIASLGTWGEAKLVFAKTEDRFIDRLPPKQWQEVANLIMLLKADIDLGPGVTSVETLTDAIHAYLNMRRPRRLDNFRRLKKCLTLNSVMVAEDRAGIPRQWIQLSDFMRWTGTEDPGRRLERSRVLADLVRMERQAERPCEKPVQWRIHLGTSEGYRDTTSIFYGLDPGRFPVPEYCLEPEDPEDLLANNPHEPGPKSTEELGEMLPWDLTPEDMGDDLEEAA